MSTENSQFDISAIQLRESKTQPKVSLSREIGEAQIVHTIFGRAKVRIIRKNDRLYRTMWLAAGVAATVIGVVVWQGWYAVQQTEAVLNPDLTGTESAQEQASGPAATSGEMALPAVSPSVNTETIAPSPTVIAKPAADQKKAPQTPGDLKETGQAVVKPVVVRPKPVEVKPKPVEPLTESKPQIAPATTAGTLKNQMDKPLPAVVAPAKRPAAPVAATPRVAQPAASGPAAAVPLASPVDAEDAATKSSVDDKQLSDPINVQSN